MGNEVAIQYFGGVEYRGEVKENLPWGRGKVTFSSGATLEGQFAQSKIRRGKLSCEDFQYEGDFRKKKLNGKGVLIDKTNTRYEGQFKDGKFVNGQITQRTQKGEIKSKYTGSVKDEGKQLDEGIWEIQKSDGDSKSKNKLDRRYEGTFQNGELVGTGKYLYPNEDTYEGGFLSGKKEGQGVYEGKMFKLETIFGKQSFSGQSKVDFVNGDTYRGNIKDGLFDGEGTYTYKDGTVYEGDFYCGQIWGQGKITYPVGGEVQNYEGQMNNGLFNGLGTIFYSNGIIFKGNFLDNIKNGFGVLIFGSSKYKCLFMMNKLIGQMKAIE